MRENITCFTSIIRSIRYGDRCIGHWGHAVAQGFWCEETSKWVMIVGNGDNLAYAEGSRTQYFIGNFDGKTFKNVHSDDTVLWLDYGRSNYGVTWLEYRKRMDVGFLSVR